MLYAHAPVHVCGRTHHVFVVSLKAMSAVRTDLVGASGFSIQATVVLCVRSQVLGGGGGGG
jgi:hypothetical protein